MADRLQIVVLSGLVVLGGASAVIVERLSSLGANISELLAKDRNRMQTLTQTVNNSSGDPVTITTTRNDGESVADFVARHNAVVAYVKTH